MVLAVGLASAPPAQAEPVNSSRPKVKDHERTVDGRNLKVRPRTSDPSATSHPTARATWPKPGKAQAALPAATGRAPASLVRAGDLPIWVGPPSGQPKAAQPKTGTSNNATPSPGMTGEAKVEVLDRKTAQRAGIAGMAFAVTPADSAKAGRVAVRLDYSAFAQAFGGSYGSRLRLVQLPACALTTPTKPQCRTNTPIPTANDGEKQTLTADVDTTPPAAAGGQSSEATPTVLAAAAAPEGSQGDFKATTLEASATWKVSGNTGDFTWNYPMRVPPVPGGLAPKVELGYSAQSVDGRTGNTNNQPSWAGEGFDLSPGFIERRYKSCEDDGAKNAEGKIPGDQCWGYDNATVTWNGKGGELIKAANGTWRLKNDDGTRFKKIVSRPEGDGQSINGDNDGEYWEVTTTDGTRYYFGRNQLPGYGSGGPQTNSAWTVPVFGDDAGGPGTDDDEPCHKSSGFADSWCQQAWRWNLDMVVDPNDNALFYVYEKEINHYGRNLKPADATPYTRGGYLKSIDYGVRGTNVFASAAPAVVEFATAERCIPSADFDCAPAKISTNPEKWPDVPWNMNCAAGTECTGDHGSTSPTFWSRKRLTKVTTRINRGAGWGYRNVDSWALDHAWGAETDERDLLAKDIEHKGLAGPTTADDIALPKVSFKHVPRANRVDQANDGIAPYTRYRVSTIYDESGGELNINYTGQECSRSAPPTPQTNGKRCFPSIWHLPGQTTPYPDWFNKYVVTSVVQKDRTGHAPDMATTYEYIGDAAWHFDDDDGLTREKFKTWSQWRGYGHVRVKTGSLSSPSTQTDTYYLRGMHGDRATPTGGTKTVKVSDGENAEPHTDYEGLDGFELKTVSYTASGGPVHNKTVNVPWRHQTATRTRSWGTVTANNVQVDNSRTWTAMDGGTWRQTKITSDYETEFEKIGRVTQVSDLGDVTADTDDKCTRTEYADNVEKWMVAYKSRVETVSVACAADPDRSKHIIGDVRTFYDNGGHGSAPTKGDITRTEKIAEYDGGGARYVTDKVTGYDTFGRPISVTDALGRTTSTRHTQTNGLTTKTVVTTPPATPGNAATALTTTQELDPAFGQPTGKIDANGQRSDIVYDALGRARKAWLPNWPKKDNATPSLEFGYRLTDGQIVAVTSKTLTNTGGQRTSIELFDGWLRTRQTQVPGPEGRLIADTFYDTRGKVAKKYDLYSATGAPELTLFGVDSPGNVETQTHYSYDGLGRQTLERLLIGNGSTQEKWRTTTSYGGNWKATDPPDGGISTAEITDARGQVIERRQYVGQGPSGSYDATTYTYDPGGRPATITDASGNRWTTTYDLRGRKARTTDPDKGTTTLTYDDVDRLTSTTDARDKTIVHVYDGLDRKTETREGSVTGPRLASWTYDTATRGKGLPASSTRHSAAGDYTSQVSGYDVLGRAETTLVTIPTSEGALAGSYAFSQTYNLDGTPKTQGLPAAGGLPAETLTRTYDNHLRPTRLTSDLSVYVGATDYTPTGKQKLVELGAGGKRAWNTQTWEYGTQRLATSRTHRESITGDDRNATYTYDDAGNIKSISDVSTIGTDNQCFAYDYLRRLTEAWTEADNTCSATPTAPAVGGPVPYWQSFAYDKASNRTKEIQHGTGGQGDTTRTYAYAGPGKGSRLNAVTQTGAAGNRTDTFAYDNVGNTTNRTLGTTSQTLDWDAEGKLTKVTEGGKTTSFIYDAAGNRLIRKDSTGATLYLPDTEVRVTTGNAAAAGTRYYTHNNQTVAMRDSTGLRHLTGDHQGTSQIAVNATDQKTITRRFLPFGRERGALEEDTWPGERGFVGGTKDPTGLTHLGAREYDPETGRFISVDPLFNLDHPQSWNGYSYANNTPVTQSDPEGLDGPLRGNRDCYYSGTGCEKPKPNGGWDGDELEYPETFPERPENQARQDQYRRRIEQLRETPIDPGTSAGAVTLRMRIQAELAYCAEFPGDAQICGNRDASVHESLDAMGLAGLDAADAANAILYLSEGKWKDALLSGLAVIPFLGGLATAKRASKGARTCSSFVPGTAVLMANGEPKAIEEVEVGDKVLATDPETGKTETKTVLATITSKGKKNLVQISIDTHNQKFWTGTTNQEQTSGANFKIQKSSPKTGLVIATDTHPFWVASGIDKWIKAIDLKPGMWLRTSAGTYVQVTATKSRTTHEQRVHNLTIADHHTYYVHAGDTPVLVHNSNGCFSTHNERAGDLADRYTEGQSTRDPSSQWYHEMLSNEELLASINQAAAGDGILVSRGGQILGGHHRWDELQKRIRDGRIDPDEPIRIEVYGGD
ncbi:RHS repeat-associated core domain-containing protein [Actinomadura fulvescens]|uniref:RHS repeat-associated core domain-containing protein n=2 Tax=Actinomadura fulvescens TaxID=46160 RepID=A0ABP6D623_9ACTN